MIRKYKKEDFWGLYYFIINNLSEDFYYTEQNSRVFVRDYKYLINFLRNSKALYVCEENSDISGIVLIWSALGGNIKRSFVKMCAVNSNIADKLLTTLLWNENGEFYTKIKKNSDFLKVFKIRGFGFRGNRGSEFLLYKLNRVVAYVNSKNQDED